MGLTPHPAPAVCSQVLPPLIRVQTSIFTSHYSAQLPCIYPLLQRSVWVFHWTRAIDQTHSRDYQDFSVMRQTLEREALYSVFQSAKSRLARAILLLSLLQWCPWYMLWVQQNIQFSCVAQSCLTLCSPMNRSMPGLSVHHQLPESTQTHVHRVSDAIQLSHPLSSPSPLALNLSQYQGLFQWVNSSHEVAKVLEFQLQHESYQWTLRTDLL